MAQISITIPNDLEEILNLLSSEQKRSKSELASHALELGLAQYLEALNKREVYKSLVEKRKAKATESASAETTD
jgi:metal-responsive CopG/Arc/MetJ family transcriptional regulator